MGSLIAELPVAENNATLEILGLHGVSREDLARFRAAPRDVQAHIAEIISSVDFIDSLSHTSSKPVKSVRFSETMIVQATNGFRASDWYVASPTANVRIGYMSDNFRHMLLPRDEDAMECHRLRYMALKDREWKASKVAFDLGGRHRACITLGEFYQALADLQQKRDYEIGLAAFVQSMSGQILIVFALWKPTLGWSISIDIVDRRVRDTNYRFVTRV